MAKKIGYNKPSVISYQNLTKQPVPTTKLDRGDGITVWETESTIKGRNDFPQQLLQAVYNSPVASAAMDVWQEFIEGDGFIQQGVDQIPVNSNGDDGLPESLEAFHSKISQDFAYLWGFAIHVGYNANGEKSEFHHIPFETVRLGILDENGTATDIRSNPYYGIPSAFEKRFTKVYYPYNPDPEHVKKQILNHKKLQAENKVDFDYPGQVFWYSIEKPLARVYPQPFYYSSMNWFVVDSKIQQFHERNVDNNFLLSVMINMFGDPSLPADSADENKDQYETIGEVFNTQLKEQLSGTKNGGSAIVNWFQREEEKAKIEAFPSNTHHDLFLNLQNIVTDQIAIGTKVPRVLISIAEGGKLGDTQEILNAVKVMQGRVNRMQRTLERVYQKVFFGFAGTKSVKDWTIKRVNPFDIVPEWVINLLTDDEKRKYISENFNIELALAPVVDPALVPEVPQTNEALANMTGRQLQGIQRVVRKFNKDELTFEQAAQLLKSGFAFTDEQVNDWLVTKDEENGDILN